ncbi:MAG: hypothetical protein RL685_4793 [Pseudomonadota bacterium]|jgi:hypothetical protein
MTPLAPESLEQQLLELCGLSSLLAPGLLRRALADAGAATPPTAEDLLRALPQIECRMRAYLPALEVRQRSARMRAVLTGQSGSAPPKP